MKLLLPFFSLLLFLVSCIQQESTTHVLSANQTDNMAELPVKKEKILGTYTGDFNGSPVAITLRYLAAGRISGYNVHKGLKRNLTGTINLKNNVLHLQLTEPGTNPYDGSFDLELDTVTWTGNGKWTPLKKGEVVSFKFSRADDWARGGYLYTPFLDSLQNTIELKPDGSCVYNLLVNDTLATAQQITLRGNYHIDKDSTVRIFWQKNEIIPSGKSLLHIFIVSIGSSEGQDDFYQYGLRGPGFSFQQNID
jgi:hypothetical protein